MLHCGDLVGEPGSTTKPLQGAVNMIYSSVKLFITWLGHSPAIESVIVWLYIEVHHQMKLSWTRNANNQRMFYPQCYSNCNIGLGNSLDFPKVSKLWHIVHSWPCFDGVYLSRKLGMHSDPSSDGFALSDTLTVRQSTSLCLGWPLCGPGPV